ncbi:hypothetical protein D3C78_1533890 [compost metagenome]
MGNDHSGINLHNLAADEELIECLTEKLAERLAARQSCKASTIKEAAEAFREIVQENERLKFLGD